ncbi:MAG TPA: cytochrome-c oxidase, cbb3-type subunit III [Burkholderiaceae bacterium]
MSDFNNDGWSFYVGVVTVLGLVACVVLLFVAARVRPMAADNSTGHVWDEDLRELNNPLPRWWMWLYLLTVGFSGVYLGLYPGLGKLAGLLGWSSLQEYETERVEARAVTAPLFASFAPLSFDALARDKQAHAIGERLFANNCAGCHGADARGSKGFPNLTDHDWLYGGAPEQIIESITKGREGTMPPMAAAVGNADDVRNLANYVLSLSGSEENKTSAQLGRSSFTACAACHGVKGGGNIALGAPNLSDQIWLHGWGVPAVTAMINKGKHSVMPAHGERLSSDEIRVLAAYVWGLSAAEPGTVRAAALAP